MDSHGGEGFSIYTALFPAVQLPQSHQDSMLSFFFSYGGQIIIAYSINGSSIAIDKISDLHHHWGERYDTNT